RFSVSWKVECTPNRRRNCLGWTSREAGHNRVPAPPHMINGIIRPSISNLVVAAPAWLPQGCALPDDYCQYCKCTRRAAARPLYPPSPARSIALFPPIARTAAKPYQGGRFQRAIPPGRAFDTPQNQRPPTMRRILLSALKILVSAALLYLALRKVDFHELASRFDVASFGWIGLAILATLVQIFLGVLRWREISAECGAPLGLMQATRFNMIGQFFNQTLPSSI